MYKRSLITLSLIFSLSGVISAKAFAQETPVQAPQEAPAASAPAAPSEPVTGYKGMLPYVQENAALRKEAARKYGSTRSGKKSKKSKSKTASKKKSSRSSASVKSGTKKKKKKSPSSR